MTQNSVAPEFAAPELVAPSRRPPRHVIKRWLWVPRPLDEVFPFFAAAENLGKITPPELRFRIRSNLPIEMKKGALIDYSIGLYGIPLKWRTKITSWHPPHAFEDTQISGPYAEWVHLHSFIEDSEGTTIIDRVTYSLPFGSLGELARPFVRRQLKRIFDYREDRLSRIFR